MPSRSRTIQAGTKNAPASKKHPREETLNVYEASASLTNIHGGSVLPKAGRIPNNIVPVSADELIARRPAGAKALHAIADQLALVKDLPDSDLLKAVHDYVSRFYAAKGWEEIGMRCMDESALLAMGILLEETMREVIGKDGAGALEERDEEWLDDDDEGESVGESGEEDTESSETTEDDSTDDEESD